jgi:hypothetical protein
MKEMSISNQSREREPRAVGNVDMFMRELLGSTGNREEHYKYGAKVYKYERGTSLRRHDREDAVPFADSANSTVKRMYASAHAVLGDGNVRVCLYGRDLCLILQEDKDKQPTFFTTELDMSKIENGTYGVAHRGRYAIIVTQNDDKTDVFLCDSEESFKANKYEWTATIAEGYGSGFETDYE